MFVYLSKILPLFVYPLGVVCFFILMALILDKHNRLRRVLLIFALIILLISSNRWVSFALARSLEWRDLPPEEMPQAPVIVVLGGGTESADPPRPMSEVNSAGDRVIYAARLYQEGVAPHILVSGGNVDFSTSRGTTPAEEMTELLTLMDVPENAIWQQQDSQNTHEDALYSAEILTEKNIAEIILVTSAIHMPRAKALFEHHGFVVTPAPVDFAITEQNWESSFHPEVGEFFLYLLPNASALSMTTNVIKEYLGLFMYGRQGWL